MEIVTLVIGLLGGGSAICTGLFTYYGSLRLERFKAELQITNLKVKSLTETSSHLTKSQFDKEFSIYQEIWIELVELKSKTFSLRPILDYQEPNVTEEEKMQQRLNGFADAINSFRNVMDKNKPFYEITVHNSLNNIFGLCYEESVDYQHDNPEWNKEYWKQARENNKNIIAAIDECCEKIRSRISSLAVFE